MAKLLLRPEEAAELLGIGRSRMYELIARGEVPRVLIGKTIRVPFEELSTWVRERTGRSGGTESEARGPDER